MPESTPLQFDVPDMECEACVKSVTEAVQRVSPGAHVSADLATKRVVIGAQGDPHAFMAAIEDAGFTIKASE